jgi:hypothetical protein
MTLLKSGVAHQVELILRSIRARRGVAGNVPLDEPAGESTRCMLSLKSLAGGCVLVLNKSLVLSQPLVELPGNRVTFMR